MAYAGRVTTPEAEQGGVAGEGRATPQDGAPRPEDGASRPEDGASRPEDGASRPEDGASRPEDGASRPEDGASRPEDGALRPEDGALRPEERLERAVRAAEQALIEYEIAVETFRVEIENFSRLHHQKLGPMYARLEELDAQIAEAKAARTGDPEDLRRAGELRARVLPMPSVEELFHGWMDGDGLFPEAAAMLTDQPVRPPQRVRPSEEARRIYRELARKAHPDLAREEDERKRREEFLTRVNMAYARGDAAALRELSEEWAAGPVPEERRWSRSEELYARLDWLAQRKELLTVVARELEEGAIGSMLKLAPDDPDRLLDEIAERLLAEVAQREAELAALIGQ
ncbi:hypothetical protein GCM10010254_03930 [Streptomyces chromofuscus]|nr:hypothetical protein GCM10010254_03930 [Streptomyces chromofuscus]